MTSMSPLPLVIFLLRKIWAEQALLSLRAALYKMCVQVHFLMSKDKKKTYSVWTKCSGIHCWPRPRDWSTSSPPLAKLKKILVFVIHWAAKGNFCVNKFKLFGKILNLWLHSYECASVCTLNWSIFMTFLRSCFIPIFFCYLLTLDAYLSSALLTVSH